MGGIMIRTFRLYKLEHLKELPSNLQAQLPKVKLADLALTAPKPLSRSMEDLANLLKGESLQLVKVGPPTWELELTGRWPARSISVATELPPFVPVRVKLWLRWLVPWLIIFEANRALTEAASRLVAATFAGDVTKAYPIKPDLRHWQALKEWVEEDSSGTGSLLGGRFYKAVVAGVPVESIELRCVPGADKRLILDSFKTATGIGELFLQSPKLSTINKYAMFRINRLGMVRVYGEEIPDQLIDALLTELETLWGFISNEKT
jgi:hypothetical protein